jgi:hypothetical protein
MAFLVVGFIAVGEILSPGARIKCELTNIRSRRVTLAPGV